MIGRLCGFLLEGISMLIFKTYNSFAICCKFLVKMVKFGFPLIYPKPICIVALRDHGPRTFNIDPFEDWKSIA